MKRDAENGGLKECNTTYFYHNFTELNYEGSIYTQHVLAIFWLFVIIVPFLLLKGNLQIQYIDKGLINIKS